MFDAARRSSGWGVGVLLALMVGGVGWGVRAGGLEAVDRLARGVPLGARPLATTADDRPYTRSPLATALALEAAWVPVDAASALALGDRLAETVGTWMLETTGAPDLEAAERALWAEGRIDALPVRLATAMRDAEVHARAGHRLSEGAAGVPVYAHPDDLTWLMAHVAWRLDLAFVVVPSPVHHYLLLRGPDGRARGVEATCFRRVDALGKVVPHDQPSVGRRLVFPPEHYPSGAGGIRAPDRLPAGVYEPLEGDEALEAAIRQRLEARHGPVPATGEVP